MSTQNDPRVEAVAKLLFTSPIYQHNAGDWETDRSDYYYDRRMCLMAAEDVLRGIDEAGARDMLAKNRAAIDYELSVEAYYQRHVRGQKAPE